MQSSQVSRRSTGWGGISRLVEGPLAWFITLLVIPAMLAAVLLLPPVNLLNRLQVFTYNRIGSAGGSVADPDGTVVLFPVEGVASAFGARLSSTPREEFFQGQAGSDLYTAAQSLPNYLVSRSPLYQLDLSGDAPTQVILNIPIPNDSIPYEKLGLYSWNGTTWEQVPSSVLMPDEKIEARLDYVPASFMVMQTVAKEAAVAADLGSEGQLPNGAVVAIQMKAGLLLRGDGALDGVAPPNEGTTVPVIRNWESGVVRTDLVNNLLMDPGQQENQLTAIEQLSIEQNYLGIAIDYRGVDALPTARADFVHLMRKLAERLHNAGKTLTVRVEAPTQISAEEWDTQGYDWRNLGKVVDKLIIPAPVDPRAYQANGEMEALLRWATSEVERRKIQIELSGQSVERAGNYLLLKGYQAALQPLISQVQAESGANSGEVVVDIQNPKLQDRVTWDEALGVYSYTYLDDQSQQRTVYIESASSISRKLALLQKYNVSDVTLNLAASNDIDPKVWETLLNFQQGRPLSAGPAQMFVAYTVLDEAGKVVAQDKRPLDNARMSLAANVAGALKINAQLVDEKGGALSALFSKEIAGLAGQTAKTALQPASESLQTAALGVSQQVNVREGPATQYPILGQVQPGGSFKIIAKNNSGDWWKIDIGNGSSGWVIGQLVNLTGDTNGVAVDSAVPELQVASVSAESATAASAPEAKEEEPAAPAQAPASAPVVSAPPPSGGGSFGYGVQAHMVDTGMTSQAMGVTKNMGFNWIKQQVAWTRFEGSPGSIDYGALDDMVNTANGAGLSLLFSIVKSPPWAREGGFDASVEGPPADPATYARFVGAVAGKYCGSSLKAIEVWNEQNLHYEWGNKALNPGDYMALLIPAYAAIKAACPSMVVISGALTPAGSNPGKAVDDFEYLRGMFAAGLTNYADGIGAHPSGYNVPASVTWEGACAAIQVSGNSFNGACDSPHHSWSFRSTMEGYRGIMNENGASNKLVWATEFGWAANGAVNANYKYADDNDFAEQAQWTVEAYQMMKAWGWAGPAFLWNLNFRVTNPGTELAQWGIVSQDWSPLPIYNALAAMQK